MRLMIPAQLLDPAQHTLDFASEVLRHAHAQRGGRIGSPSR